MARATDENNYYGVRLAMTGSGPLPQWTIERWTVVEGRESQRTRIPLSLTAARDTLFRISLEVRDQFFTLMIQDQVVDFWSDAQLRSGGIGFFAAKGEQALIQMVRLTDQYDTIGRICAALILRD